MSYEAKTTQIQRAECLDAVRKAAYGPGLDLMRQILMDLDAAESHIDDLYDTLTEKAFEYSRSTQGIADELTAANDRIKELEKFLEETNMSTTDAAILVMDKLIARQETKLQLAKEAYLDKFEKELAGVTIAEMDDEIADQLLDGQRKLMKQEMFLEYLKERKARIESPLASLFLGNSIFGGVGRIF